MRLPISLAPPRTRLSLENRPDYPEAYPRLSVGEADRRCRDGYDHLLWRDTKRIVAGAARATWTGRGELGLRYLVEEREYLEQAAGELTLRITWKGSQENNRRPFAACPECGRDVDVLVFHGRWCCTGGRHGLRHRTARLSQEVRWSEELADLEGAIAIAEAIGSSGKRLQAKVDQRDELLARLKHRTVTANVMQLARYTGEWVRPLRVQGR